MFSRYKGRRVRRYTGAVVIPSQKMKEIYFFLLVSYILLSFYVFNDKLLCLLSLTIDLQIFGKLEVQSQCVSTAF